MTPTELDITNELVDEGWDYRGESDNGELMFTRVFDTVGTVYCIALRKDR